MNLEELLAQPERVSEISKGEIAALIQQVATLLAHVSEKCLNLDQGEPKNRNATPIEADRLLTPDEAADRLGVTRAWMYRHASKLPFTRRISRKVLRFSGKGLERWLETRKP